MRYFVPSGTKIYLPAHQLPKAQKSPRLPGPSRNYTAWVPEVSTKDAYFTERDINPRQVADRDTCFEFLVSFNSRSITYFAVYKKDVVEIG